MIRALIVHSTRLACSLYASVLDDQADIHVVAWATTVREALAQIESGHPNMVLISVTLPDHGALKLTKEIAQTYPEIKVLIVGIPESKYVILQYIMAGASGYVLEDVTVERLLKNVEAVQEDKALVSPSMAAALISHITELAHISPRPYLERGAYAELTPRELEVLELIDEGRTNQEIARRLYIEVGTVKNHVHNILRKLDVTNREDAAAHLPFIIEEEDKSGKV